MGVDISPLISRVYGWLRYVYDSKGLWRVLASLARIRDDGRSVLRLGPRINR